MPNEKGGLFHNGRKPDMDWQMQIICGSIYLKFNRNEGSFPVSDLGK